MSAVSLADVKEHLRITNTDHDTQLQKFINRAEAAIGRLVGPLTPVSKTSKLDGGGTALILPFAPVASLTSVTYGNGSTVTLTDLDLDTDTGIVRWNYGTAGRFTAGVRNVTVVYSNGWASLPDDLVQGVLELVRHLWDTQRGNKPGRTAGDEFLPGSFATWPPRVQELIAPFRALVGA